VGEGEEGIGAFSAGAVMFERSGSRALILVSILIPDGWRYCSWLESNSC
jgi:hypothetical protein